MDSWIPACLCWKNGDAGENEQWGILGFVGKCMRGPGRLGGIHMYFNRGECMYVSV
jgi:hypothetical protein